MAEKEMEYMVDLFNKLTHTCFNKCIENKYRESELNMGENSCIDRCVSKYWQVAVLSELTLSKSASERLLTMYFPFLGFAILAFLRGLTSHSGKTMTIGKRPVLNRKKRA